MRFMQRILGCWFDLRLQGFIKLSSLSFQVYLQHVYFFLFTSCLRVQPQQPEQEFCPLAG